MDIKKALFDALITKFSDNVSDDAETLTDLLFAAGKASQALLLSVLFMPEFKIIGDSVVLARSLEYESAESNFVGALAKGEMSREKVETSFNFVEIGYLFDTSGSDTTDEEDELLAELVRDAWDGWLRASFPNRRFTVEVVPPEVTGSTVGVHFYENR